MRKSASCLDRAGRKATGWRGSLEQAVANIRMGTWHTVTRGQLSGHPGRKDSSRERKESYDHSGLRFCCPIAGFPEPP
jgi:hypothetical protein